jgi:pyrroloquinoline quinone (PQQ) biosynthesis protein C
VIPPLIKACFYAWTNIAIRNPWLTAFTSSQMLERRNNGNIVKGGGMSFRVGQKFEKELGINLKRMVSLDVHVAADMDHSDSMSEVYERYVKTAEDCDLVLRGAQESMTIDRAFRGAMAYYMERIE